MKKEFWINLHHNGTPNWTCRQTPAENTVHVIEYSEYEDLCFENKQLKKALNEIFEDADKLLTLVKNKKSEFNC